MLSKAIYTPARTDLWVHCLQHEGSFKSNFELIFPASFGIFILLYKHYFAAASFYINSTFILTNLQNDFVENFRFFFPALRFTLA